MSQQNVIPVSFDAIMASIKRLKCQSYDIDGICAFHLSPHSKELLSHLQLLFQMCLCNSVVPDSSLDGTVTSVLKRGKDL